MTAALAEMPVVRPVTEAMIDESLSIIDEQNDAIATLVAQCTKLATRVREIEAKLAETVDALRSVIDTVDPKSFARAEHQWAIEHARRLLAGETP